MSFETQAVLHGIVAPAIVSLVSCLVLLGFGNRAGGWGQRAASPVAIGAGFIAAFLLFPWARLTPVENWDWLPYLATAAALFGMVGHARGVLLPERWALYVFLALASGWFLVPDWENLQPPRSEQLAIVASMFIIILALWDQIASRAYSPALPCLVVLVCVASAVVLQRSGNAKLAQLAGALTASSGAIAIVATWRSDLALLPTAMPVVATILGGLLYSGQVSSSAELSLAAYVLPVLAPAGLLLTRSRPSAGANVNVRLAIDALIVAAPLVIAVLLAF